MWQMLGHLSDILSPASEDADVIDVTCDHRVSRRDPPKPSRQRNKLDPKAGDQFQRGQAQGWGGGGLWGVPGAGKTEARPCGGWERGGRGDGVGRAAQS